LLEKEKKKILKLSLLDLTPMQLKIIGLRFFTDEKQNKSLNSLANELCLEKSKLIRIYKMALLELREKCKDY
jgi:DNA-directed RNA polymerase sigma subunit (sigma70/sigma32)